LVLVFAEVGQRLRGKALAAAPKSGEKRRRTKARFRRVGFAWTSPHSTLACQFTLGKGRLPTEANLLNVRFHKHLLANNFHHFSISVATLAKFQPCQMRSASCQRKAEGRICPGGSFRPTNVRAARRFQAGLTTVPPAVVGHCDRITALCM